MIDWSMSIDPQAFLLLLLVVVGLTALIVGGIRCVEWAEGWDERHHGND